MKNKFTEEDITLIVKIIEQYRDVSSELYSYQKKAEEIQEKVISLEKNLKEIKDRENKLMADLHKKYGDFSLQDIYNAIN